MSMLLPAWIVVQNHAVLDAVDIHCEISFHYTWMFSSFMISAMRTNLPFLTCFQ